MEMQTLTLAAEYEVELSDGNAGDTQRFAASDDRTAVEMAKSAASEWAEEGDWGPAGASIDVSWELRLAGQKGVLARGCETVVIPADDEGLQRQGGVDPSCTHTWEPCYHGDWAAEGAGGVTHYYERCQDCGGHRTLTMSPDHPPTFEYARWCAVCESTYQPGEHCGCRA